MKKIPENVRKFLTLFLAFTLVLSLFTMSTLTAFADGEPATPTDLGGTDNNEEGGDDEGGDGNDNPPPPTMYTLTFVLTKQAGDGTLYEEKVQVELEEGASLEGHVPTPTHDFYTVSEHYEFTGWSPSLPATATQSKKYTAEYRSEPRQYKITWKYKDVMEDNPIDVSTGTYVEYAEDPSPFAPVSAGTKFETYNAYYEFLGWNETIQPVSGEATYTGNYKITKKTYTITWKNDEGGTIDTTTAEWGTIPAHSDPTKDPSESEVFTFSHWDPAPEAAYGPAEYTAVFTGSPRPYKITFVTKAVSEDGKSLVDVTTTANVPFGTSPAGSFPSAAETLTTETTVYSFSAWSPEVHDVDGEETYTATYTPTLKTFPVTWKWTEVMEDNAIEVSTKKDLSYGADPSEFEPDIPKEFTTYNAVYKFDGWDKSYSPVTGEATYTATYAISKRTFTITWNNDEGELIDTTQVAYGDVPSHDNPTKEPTVDTVYSFAGWDPEPSEVYGPQTYQATFDSATRKYDVIFKYLYGDESSDKPSEGSTSGSYEYNADLTDPGASDFETLGHKYEFTGWSPELVSPVVGEATYTAQYKVTPKMFTITWVLTAQEEDGTLVEVKTDKAFEYGASLEGEFPAVEPVFYTDTEVYTFAQWSPEPQPAVTGNQTYTAEYSSMPITELQYAITWKNDAGEVIDVTLVNYGDTPTHADPTKTPTNELIYVFSGWTPEVVPATSDATYTATFQSMVRTYTVTWYYEDGETILQQQSLPYNAMPEYTGDKPTKAATKDYTYEFAGWTPEVVPVVADAAYTAVFTAKPVTTYTQPPLTVAQRSSRMNRKFAVYYGETPEPLEPEPALVVEWGQVSGVATYEIYVGYLEDGIPTTPRVTVNYGAFAAYVTDFNDHVVDPSRSYIAFVVAKNRKGEEVGRTVIAYVAGPDAEYTNPASLTVSPAKSVTLKVGESVTISASVTLEDSSKPQIPGVPDFRYSTTFDNIATVSDNGTITAVRRGTCIVQVYTKNGLVEEITVNVK